MTCTNTTHTTHTHGMNSRNYSENVLGWCMWHLWLTYCRWWRNRLKCHLLPSEWSNRFTSWSSGADLCRFGRYHFRDTLSLAVKLETPILEFNEPIRTITIALSLCGRKWEKIKRKLILKLSLQNDFSILNKYWVMDLSRLNKNICVSSLAS
jgi:hypothetical protein